MGEAGEWVLTARTALFISKSYEHKPHCLVHFSSRCSLFLGRWCWRLKVGKTGDRLLVWFVTFLQRRCYFVFKLLLHFCRTQRQRGLALVLCLCVYYI